MKLFYQINTLFFVLSIQAQNYIYDINFGDMIYSAVSIKNNVLLINQGQNTDNSLNDDINQNISTGNPSTFSNNRFNSGNSVYYDSNQQSTSTYSNNNVQNNIIESRNNTDNTSVTSFGNPKNKSVAIADNLASTAANLIKSNDALAATSDNSDSDFFTSTNNIKKVVTTSTDSYDNDFANSTNSFDNNSTILTNNLYNESATHTYNIHNDSVISNGNSDFATSTDSSEDYAPTATDFLSIYNSSLTFPQLSSGVNLISGSQINYHPKCAYILSGVIFSLMGRMIF